MNFRLTAILFGTVFVVGLILLILSFGDNKDAKPEVLAAELAAAGVTADKPEPIDAVEFERADGAVLSIVRTDKERNTWQIQKPVSAPADAVRVLSVVKAVLAAKPTAYKDLSPNPAVHGLDPPSL